MMARLSDVSLPLDSGDCGLISCRAIDHLRRMPEHHRYLRGFADGIFALSIVPIRAAALLGAGVMLISIMYVCYSLYAKLILHISPQGFTALIVAGAPVFFLGVIGEYVGRIYEETKARPFTSLAASLERTKARQELR